MSGLFITGSGNKEYDAGINLASSEHHTIFDNHISNNKNGICIWSSNSTITGNTISNNTKGIYLRENSYFTTIAGNDFWNHTQQAILILSNHNTISDNWFVNNSITGVRVQSSAKHNVIENNIIENTTGRAVFFYSSGKNNKALNNTINSATAAGIALYDSSNDNVVINNTCQDALVAIDVRDSYHNQFLENTCTNSSYGIRFLSADDNTASNNTFAGKDEGIRLASASHHNALLNNTITGNRIGIYLYTSSRDNVAHFNIITGNIEYGISASDNLGHSINATSNWWGHISGPYHPTQNPDGTGDNITDEVGFDPWTGKDIFFTRYVDDEAPDGGDGSREHPFNNIQDAVDAVGEGGTVYVWNGSYPENVIINKTLTIIGNGSANTTIDGGGSGHVVEITAAWVNLSGFTLTNAGSGKSGILVDSWYNHISGNNCSGNDYGITLLGSGNTLESNNCSSGDTGIYLYYSNTNSLMNISCEGNDYGIYLTRSSNNTLVNTTITLSRDIGIGIWESHDNSLEQSTLTGNRYGIHLLSLSRNNTAHNTTIAGNRYGIHASDNGGHYINVTGCWWGSVWGPHHQRANPKGTGDNITDLVLFDPWSGKERVEAYVDDDAPDGGDGSREHPFNRIQDAVNATVENGTVYVLNGTYYENVKVNKTINLVGAGPDTTVIDGGGSGDVVVITADWVNMSGFRVTGSGDDWEDSGIEVKADHSHIFDNNCSGNENGISLDYANHNTLTNNSCHSNGDNGIRVYYSDYNTLTGNNCSLSSSHHGISLRYSYQNTLEDNSCFSNDDSGIFLFESHRTSASGNACQGNARGVSLGSAFNNIISNNTLRYNEDDGIHFFNQIRFNTIPYNIITHNGCGIAQEGDPYENSIQYNEIWGNTNYGIRSEDVTIEAWNNWWGDDSGPYHETENPDGTGDKIAGKVEFKPWMKRTKSVQNIDTGTWYLTIEDAVTWASAGDTIKVHDGRYCERLTINTSLTLMGNGSERTIIDAYGSGNALHITADRVNVSGFRLELGGSSRAGVKVEASNTTLVDLNCSRNHDGIRLLQAAGTTITNISSWNNTQYGIYGEMSNHTTIAGANCSENDVGIYLKSSPNTTLSNVSSHNHRLYGIWLEGLTNGNVQNANSSYNGRYGLFLDRSTGIKIRGSTFAYNYYDGIYLRNDSNSNTLTAVACFFNDYGINIEESINTTITNSTLSWNRVGLYLEGSSEMCRITGSEISGNTELGIHATNNDGFHVNATGNWWGGEFGPYHETLNPYGNGDNVTDDVLFDPWTGKEHSHIRYVDDDASGGGDGSKKRPFTSIRDAVEAVVEGGMVYVWEGVYNESVEIEKTLSIIGNGSANTTIDRGGDDGDLVTITADGVTMSGFTVSTGGGFGTAIRVESSSCHIFANNCSGNTYGIILLAPGTTLEDNNCSSNQDSGIYIRSSPKGYAGHVIRNNTCLENGYHGINMWGSDHVTFEGNTCSRNGIYGMRIQKSDESVLTNNSCSWNGKYGIHIYDSYYGTFTNNHMLGCGFYLKGILEVWNSQSIDTSNTVNGRPLYYSANQTGGTIPAGAGQIILANCSSVVVEDQTVAHCTAGILLGFSTYTTINNTSCSDSIYGIYLYQSSHNLITNTSCQDNDYAIYVAHYSDYNAAHNNSLFSNSKYGLYIDSSSDYLDATMNWWGHVSGPYHASGNPHGRGDNISSWEGFEPWIGHRELPVHNVNQGSYYDRIQDAIDAADAGDIIKVNASTYHERISIDKPLTLIGNGSAGTTIDGGGGGDVLHITSDGVRIRGFRVTGSGYSNKGIWFIGDGWIRDIAVENCLVEENYYGIEITRSYDSYVANNTCINNSHTGLNIHGREQNLVINNTCSYNGIRGMEVDGSSDVLVMNNVCTHNGIQGIWFRSTLNPGNNVVTQNKCSFNEKGIVVQIGRYDTFTNNTLTKNMIGIHVLDSEGIMVKDNFIFNNTDFGMNSTGPVTATMNWWGHVSGPYHEAENPEGRGDNVTDNVDFRPWLLVRSHPPTIVIRAPGHLAHEDERYEYLVMAEDVDIFLFDETLDWYLDTNAGWLMMERLDMISVLLTGTPGNQDIGSYHINVTVEDPEGFFDSLNFTLTVTNANDPPEITITSPEDGEELNGTVTIRGEYGDMDPGDVLRVAVRIDDGDWEEATLGGPGRGPGMLPWSFQWNTAAYSNGEHVINVRVMDENDTTVTTTASVTTTNNYQGAFINLDVLVNEAENILNVIGSVEAGQDYLPEQLTVSLMLYPAHIGETTKVTAVNGNFQADIDISGLGAGEHILVAKVTMPSGVSISDERGFVLANRVKLGEVVRGGGFAWQGGGMTEPGVVGAGDFISSGDVLSTEEHTVIRIYREHLNAGAGEEDLYLFLAEYSEAGFLLEDDELFVWIGEGFAAFFIREPGNNAAARGEENGMPDIILDDLPLIDEVFEGETYHAVVDIDELTEPSFFSLDVSKSQVVITVYEGAVHVRNADGNEQTSEQYRTVTSGKLGELTVKSASYDIVEIDGNVISSFTVEGNDLTSLGYGYHIPGFGSDTTDIALILDETAFDIVVDSYGKGRYSLSFSRVLALEERRYLVTMNTPSRAKESYRVSRDGNFSLRSSVAGGSYDIGIGRMVGGESSEFRGNGFGVVEGYQWFNVTDWENLDNKEKAPVDYVVGGGSYKLSTGMTGSELEELLKGDTTGKGSYGMLLLSILIFMMVLLAIFGKEFFFKKERR